jgi:hypothetical protein
MSQPINQRSTELDFDQSTSYDCVIMTKKLYVDDVRNPPDETWEIARTYYDAIRMLGTCEYNTVSLDHDLGFVMIPDDNTIPITLAKMTEHAELTGYDIACWLEERAANGFVVPDTILCHSANPVDRSKIEQVIKSIGRIQR